MTNEEIDCHSCDGAYYKDEVQPVAYGEIFSFRVGLFSSVVTGDGSFVVFYSHVLVCFSF